jgi:hypothetical protein
MHYSLSLRFRAIISLQNPQLLKFFVVLLNLHSNFLQTLADLLLVGTKLPIFLEDYARVSGCSAGGGISNEYFLGSLEHTDEVLWEGDGLTEMSE